MIKIIIILIKTKITKIKITIVKTIKTIINKNINSPEIFLNTTLTIIIILM